MSNIVVQAAPVVADQNIVVQARPAPAFQSNAFQNNSFQTTSFSQQAFQKCAFQYSGFQTDECEDSGRSGYWRLFFMQMQEEALKKRETDVQKAIDIAVEKLAETQEKLAPAVAKPKRKPAEVKVEEFPEVRFKRKPIYSAPKPVEVPLTLVTQVSAEIEQWVVQYQAQVYNFQQEKSKRRKQARRRAAAFLLMAA